MITEGINLIEPWHGLCCILVTDRSCPFLCLVSCTYRCTVQKVERNLKYCSSCLIHNFFYIVLSEKSCHQSCLRNSMSITCSASMNPKCQYEPWMHHRMLEVQRICTCIAAKVRVALRLGITFQCCRLLVYGMVKGTRYLELFIVKIGDTWKDCYLRSQNLKVLIKSLQHLRNSWFIYNIFDP